MNAKLAITIDLGGTQTRAAIVNVEGTILSSATQPTKAAAGADAVVEQMVDLVARLRNANPQSEFIGVGLSSPGPLDTDQGIALGLPTIVGFDDFPIRTVMNERLGMPVILENDGIAAAIGEWKMGAGKSFANMVYVTVSTGIGGGVIADNRVVRGRRGMAGHVGHMSFVRGGERCFCGNHGCFEAYGSGSAFTARAKAAVKGGNSTLSSLGSALTAEAVFLAAQRGDVLAKSLVQEEASILGEGFASLLHLYSPDILVMGGGLSNAFDQLLPSIMASMQRCAMPAFRDTPVAKASLGGNSGLVGAAALVFDALSG